MTTRKVNKAFNNIIHAPTPKPADACVHHYIVGPLPRQHHWCTKCKIGFDQPFNYGGEMKPVGLGKVRPSTRYASVADGAKETED